jgi:aryl-alcohol dehydrogenase-like predicted oxidoreductase
MLFGGQTDEAEAVKIIDRALDAGINFLDTANIYNRGRSEEIVGRAAPGYDACAHIVLNGTAHSSLINSQDNTPLDIIPLRDYDRIAFRRWSRACPPFLLRSCDKEHSDASSKP